MVGFTVASGLRKVDEVYGTAAVTGMGGPVRVVVPLFTVVVKVAPEFPLMLVVVVPMFAPATDQVPVPFSKPGFVTRL